MSVLLYSLNVCQRNTDRVLFLEFVHLKGHVETRGDKTEHLASDPISFHLSLRLGQQLALLKALLSRKTRLVTFNFPSKIGGQLCEPFLVT